MSEIELRGIFRIFGQPLDLRSRFVQTETTRETIFELRLGDKKLGEMIEFLVELAVPDFELTLEPPWDLLNRIDLRGLVLELKIVRVTPNAQNPGIQARNQTLVGFEYDGLGVSLPFMSLKKIGLWYAFGSSGQAGGMRENGLVQRRLLRRTRRRRRPSPPMSSRDVQRHRSRSIWVPRPRASRPHLYSEKAGEGSA